MDRKDLGVRGEEFAVDFLKRNGFKILARNFRASPYGEIDIVAQDRGQIVFVEVKSKTSDKCGLPEEEFNFFKKIRLRRAIQNYFWAQKIETDNWRVDLVAIDFSKDINQPEIRHYEGLDL
jgi:putative endonuclease